jgi:hypothetical protein
VGQEIYTRLGLMEGGHLTAPSPLTGAQLLKRTELGIDDLMEWVSEGMKGLGGGDSRTAATDSADSLAGGFYESPMLSCE